MLSGYGRANPAILFTQITAACGFPLQFGGFTDHPVAVFPGITAFFPGFQVFNQFFPTRFFSFSVSCFDFSSSIRNCCVYLFLR